MTERALNFLTEPLIRAQPGGLLSLPGVLAALTRDEVQCFPALRPHQGMFWHMFLVQLAALALHGARRSDIPEGEADWKAFLRGLTPDYPDDEPWCLVVDDWSQPAFMQPPVPEDVRLNEADDKIIRSADALDFLDAAKNHDIKQSIARECATEDWIFALISHQTGGTHSVQYFSTARTGNSYAPRICLGLAPQPPEGAMAQSPRFGGRFRRDVRVLLETREKALNDYTVYPKTGGLGLTWLAPWPQGAQLQIKDLDIWFIEICRRIRLVSKDQLLTGLKAVSKPKRIHVDKDAVIGDPWTPVHKTKKGRSFSLSRKGFHYREITKLLFGETDKKGGYAQNWVLPSLLNLSASDNERQTYLLVADGIAAERQKSGTLGAYSRSLPISGKISKALGPRRYELHEMAQAQITTVSDFQRALSSALILAAAGGPEIPKRAEEKSFWETLRRKFLDHVSECVEHFDRYADSIFFEHLWARFEAEEGGAEAKTAAEQEFIRRLWQRTQDIFEQFLPTMPCPSLYRPRAEARARRALRSRLRQNYPELFEKETQPEVRDDAA